MTRAMIFEGNPIIQEFFADIFGSRFPSVEILVISDANGAMEKVESFLPDIVLIDVNLRGESAFYLTQKIKAQCPGSTVLLICSYDLPEYREKAYAHGADYFMVKESAAGDYIDLIDSILSGQRHPEQEAV